MLDRFGVFGIYITVHPAHRSRMNTTGTTRWPLGWTRHARQRLTADMDWQGWSTPCVEPCAITLPVHLVWKRNAVSILSRHARPVYAVQRLSRSLLACSRSVRSVLRGGVGTTVTPSTLWHILYSYVFPVQALSLVLTIPPDLIVLIQISTDPIRWDRSNASSFPSSLTN